MEWSKPIGALAVLVVVGVVVGALLTLATNGLFTSTDAVSAVLVLLFVAISVAGAVKVGVLSSRFLSNPYW